MADVAMPDADAEFGDDNATSAAVPKGASGKAKAKAKGKGRAKAKAAAGKCESSTSAAACARRQPVTSCRPRCLLRLATLSEHFPHLGTGINAWEKIDRETQGSWAPTGLAVGIPLWYLELFLLRRGRKRRSYDHRFFWSNLRLLRLNRENTAQNKFHVFQLCRFRALSCADFSPNRMQVFGLG